MRVQVTEKFRIRTQRGEIELTPGQVITLTEEKADVLLKSGRVVPMRSEDPTKTFKGLLEKAVDETATVYRPGCLEMIREGFPDLAKEIQDAEDRINLLWLQAREGTGTMKDFEEAVGKWKRLHLRAIRFYSLVEGQEAGLSRIRNKEPGTGVKR